jgi:hypothetical protein
MKEIYASNTCWVESLKNMSLASKIMQYIDNIIACEE